MVYDDNDNEVIILLSPERAVKMLLDDADTGLYRPNPGWFMMMK